MSDRETKRIRVAIFKRSDNRCECGCRRWVTFESGRMDHFFLRAKVPQAESNCWFLHRDCDEERTRPTKTDRAHWLRLFINHATKYGYTAEAQLADTKLETLRAKGLAEVTR